MAGRSKTKKVVQCQTFFTRGAHATTDEKLATAAFAQATGYLQTHCLFRWWHRAWTTEKCMRAQQTEADKVAKWIKDKADGFLADRAHAYIGTYATTFNAAGIPPYN